jgi:hypothetical protein
MSFKWIKDINVRNFETANGKYTKTLNSQAKAMFF